MFLIFSQHQGRQGTFVSPNSGTHFTVIIWLLELRLYIRLRSDNTVKFEELQQWWLQWSRAANTGGRLWVSAPGAMPWGLTSASFLSERGLWALEFHTVLRVCLCVWMPAATHPPPPPHRLLDEVLQNPTVSARAPGMPGEVVSAVCDSSILFSHAASLWKYTISLQSRMGLSDIITHLTLLCCSSPHYVRSPLN